MTVIIGSVSRPEGPKTGRFCAVYAMPAGTASDLRQAISQDLFSRLLNGLEQRKLIARRRHADR
jgi:hypothetical protein